MIAYGLQRSQTCLQVVKTKRIDYAAGKTRLAAWAVSHCSTQSLRERYVKQLQIFIPVDVYGACGNFSCGTLGREGCLEMINRTYKFYLSFENALCKDYVTEKLYGMMHRGGIVPVVLGGANYTKLLPPRSYIDVRDFTSPKQLALYLRYLDKHDDLYNEYFEWKNRFRIVQEEFWMGPSMYCRVCEYIHRTQNQTKRYPDMFSWWNKKWKQCMTDENYHNGHVAAEVLQTWF